MVLHVYQERIEQTLLNKLNIKKIKSYLKNEVN